MSVLPLLDRDVRAERLACRPGLTSTANVAATSTPDGRSTVVAVRDGDGWRRARMPWTRKAAQRLRQAHVHEVVLRRGLRHGRAPLVWFGR